MEKVLGTHRGDKVTWDGTTVRVTLPTGYVLEITRNFEANGNLSNWLARRGVVLP